MSLSNATYNLTDNARNLADDVLQSAQEAVLATQAAADQSLDQAEDTVRALRRRADPAIDDLAARSIDYCADTSARARRQIQHAADATGRYVAAQPGKSLVIAAASGAAVATLALWLSRRRRAY
ncbi:hypothetical protein [Acidovorax sp.]|uniref:hypothetical protein n=1 Tax=Acidovorax sp. TaxID=1872122 RepID=UPI0025BB6F91|nr:hypothetical protein [Acidovorax sp.]MBW8461867.1 hypothetical protein [Acidovorax sp.]